MGVGFDGRAMGNVLLRKKETAKVPNRISIFAIVAVVMICFGQRVNAQFYAIKTNALMLPAGIVNAGMEVTLGKQWTIEVSGYHSLLKNVKASWLQPAVRWWRFEHFAGPFFAVHPAYGTFDMGPDEWHRKGWVLGGGLSYGYCWLLSRRMNFSLEGGIGIYAIKDKRVGRVIDMWSPYSFTRSSRISIGPSKFEAAVSLLF